MKWLNYLLWFVLSFVIALIALMPARWALQWLPKELPIQVWQVEGTIWNFTVGELQFGLLSYRNLQFRFAPDCLLRLSLCEHISAEEGELQLRLDPIEQSLWLENSEWYDRIDPIVMMLSPQFAGVSGIIGLDISSLQWQQQGLASLEATLQLQNLQVPSLGQLPGSVQARLQLDNNRITALISDRSAALDVAGSANIQANGQYQLDLNLANFDDAQLGNLSDLIRSSARVQKDGSYRLLQQGRAPLTLPLVVEPQ